LPTIPVQSKCTPNASTLLQEFLLSGVETGIGAAGLRNACQFASRLKNNLLPSAEIGFVSLWCFMQASDQTAKGTRT
jgi:hypothetical protein